MDEIGSVQNSSRKLGGVLKRNFLGGSLLNVFKGPIFEVLKNRPFRLLCLGEFVSVLGDQFYIVALPWLVLELTENAIAVGTVLAVASIPRAVFVLIGGVFTDRFSSRKIMIASNLARFIVVAILAVLVATRVVNLFYIYIVSFLFGIADAFFYPAQITIVYKIVPKDKLNAGNAILQGATQISTFIGPAIAGFTIAFLSNFQPGRLFLPKPHLFFGSYVGVDFIKGVDIALAIDALSFLFSLFTLWRIKILENNFVSGEGYRGVLESIKKVFKYVWRDRIIRLGSIIVGAFFLFTVGPLTVGFPILANARLRMGAASLGILLSSFGGGVLLGILIAGATRFLSGRKLAPTFIGSAVIMGVGLLVLSVVKVTWLAALVSSMMGIVVGYVQIVIVTLLQKRIPEEMMGTMMSLAMFSYLGVLPLSQVLSGALIQINFTVFFLICGLVTLGITIFTATRPELRMID